MSNFILKLFFLTLVSSLLFSQCTTNKYTPLSSEIPLNQVSYEQHIKPIVGNFCLTCHGGNTPSGDISLIGYENVRKQSEQGNLLKRINNHANPMPVGGLMPRSERELFMKWAKNSYLKSGNEGTVPKETFSFTPPQITPVNIDEHPVQFMSKMKGHWVGEMNLMGQKIPWFAFDYRPITATHIHGIFEGGSMGNLFTSFFIVNYKGVKTIMVRNGGLLNGIYRTSYFLLTEAKEENNEQYYKFVDAYGGSKIMFIEIQFKANKITLTSYTSRFGTYPKPTKHMNFTGTKMHPELADMAANKLGYPKLNAEKNYPNGLPIPDWGTDQPVTTSASFLWQDDALDLVTLGKLSQDPYRIDEIPYLATLKLNWDRSGYLKNKKIQVYLSRKPLTNPDGKINLEYGFISMAKMNEILLFPEINETDSSFTLTYLHPGKYYITLVVDENNDMIPSKGDYSNTSVLIEVEPESHEVLNLLTPTYKN